MNNEQLDYVRIQLASGVPPEELRTILREAGYQDQLIEELFRALHDPVHNQSTIDLRTVQLNEQTRVSSVQLPGYWEFIKMSWAVPPALLQIVLFGVVGWLGGALVLENFTDNQILQSVSEFMNAFTGIIVLYVMAAATAIVVRPDCITVSDGLKWANKNFLSIWWLAILLFLIQITATVLLVVPAIVLFGYLLLVFPVRAAEEKTGIKTLVRSTTLVYGRWWSVYGRMLLLFLIYILLYIAAALVSVVTFMMIGTSLAITYAVSVFMWFVLGLNLAVNVNALSIIYKYLARDTDALERYNKSSIGTLYIVLAALAPILLALLAVWFLS